MDSFTETPRQTGKQIDPQNPFDNPLENREYRTDYRKILPQILVPGYEIPLRPEYGERRALRRCMNIAGLGALSGCVMSQILYTLLMIIIYVLMGVPIFSDELAQAADYFQNSALAMGLNALIFFTLNIAITWIGCRCMKTPARSLFQTTNFTAGTAFRYAAIGIFLQCAAGLTYSFLEWLLSHFGAELGQVESSYTQTPKAAIAMVLYMVFLAPITEELLFRGFLMKTLSRVGTRFAIVVSALLFGLVHGNLAQMILGFLVGLYLGKIVVRHNSLVPSILVHMSINIMAVLMTLASDFLPDNAVGVMFMGLLSMAFYGIAILGAVLWFWKERKDPLPYPTQKQAFRSRLIWTSPMLLAAFAVESVLLIVNELLLTV